MLLGRWPGFRWIIILTGAGAGLSFLAQVFLNKKLAFGWQVGITAFGTICIALASILPLIQDRRYQQMLQEAEDAALEGKRIAHTEMQDSLMSVMDIVVRVSELPAGERRSSLKEALKQAIVDRVAREIGPDRTRSCYYRYDEGPPSVLKYEFWAGRSTKPQEEYTKATPLGRAALGMVERRQSSFRSDLDTDPPRGWNSAREQKTYIAVTVYTRQRVFGMLTLDSLNAGDLSKEDEERVKVYAGVLAAGLASGEEGERAISPEPSISM